MATERKIARGARIEAFIMGILVRLDKLMEVLMLERVDTKETKASFWL